LADLILSDTDILIDLARGDANATAQLQTLRQTSQIAISSVTEMELIVGCRNKNELQELGELLNLFQIVKLSSQISDQAAFLLRTYRLSHGLLLADALIAATALAHNIAFITRNQRDYRFIEGLNLLSYP
jgi:predicted nucleic acid-binding protein